MGNDLPFRLLAHGSLIIYLVVLICLLINMRKMVRDSLTKLIYVALIFWFLMAAKDIAYFFGDSWYDTEVTNLLMSLDMWPIAIYAAIILYILQPKWVTLARLSAIFIPFFIFTLLLIILKGNEIIFMTNQIYGIAFSTLFGGSAFILTFKFEKYIENNYSNTDSIDVKWIRYFIALLYVESAILSSISINSTWLGDAIFYLVSSVSTTLLFYYSFKQKRITTPTFIPTLKSFFSKKTEETSCEEEYIPMYKNQDKLESSLHKAIFEDKLYLNPHLSLSDLSVHIGTNRTYLSKYINSVKSSTFISYINEFRLEEANSIINNNEQHLSLAEIAEKCGFASYSTFRRCYKQRFRQPPSAYK